MKLKYEREQVVYFCRELVNKNLTTGTGGNISVFNREQGLFALSPSGMDYFIMEDEDVVVLDLEGKVVAGKLKPSVEVDLHRVMYQGREDINAVVHAHSVYATTLATLRMGVPPCHYLIGFCGRDVRCTEYVDFGTPELAEVAFEGMRERFGVLLGNHGLLTGGADIDYAFSAAEELEFVCQVYYRAKCIGEPVILSESDMDAALGKFASYGQKKLKK